MKLIKGHQAQPSSGSDAGFLLGGSGIGASFCRRPNERSLSCSMSCRAEKVLNTRTN